MPLTLLYEYQQPAQRTSCSYEGPNLVKLAASYPTTTSLIFLPSSATSSFTLAKSGALYGAGGANASAVGATAPRATDQVSDSCTPASMVELVRSYRATWPHVAMENSSGVALGDWPKQRVRMGEGWGRIFPMSSHRYPEGGGVTMKRVMELSESML